MDFSWFWKKTDPKPVLPLSIQDLEGDLVEISSQVDEFVIVSTGVETEEDIESPKESDFKE